MLYELLSRFVDEDEKDGRQNLSTNTPANTGTFRTVVTLWQRMFTLSVINVQRMSIKKVHVYRSSIWASLAILQRMRTLVILNMTLWPLHTCSPSDTESPILLTMI